VHVCVGEGVHVCEIIKSKLIIMLCVNTRGVMIHRYVLVSALFGWRYNASIQATHIAIQSNTTSIINKSNAPIFCGH